MTARRIYWRALDRRNPKAGRELRNAPMYARLVRERPGAWRWYLRRRKGDGDLLAGGLEVSEAVARRAVAERIELLTGQCICCARPLWGAALTARNRRVARELAAMGVIADDL